MKLALFNGAKQLVKVRKSDLGWTQQHRREASVATEAWTARAQRLTADAWRNSDGGEIKVGSEKIMLTNRKDCIMRRA